MSGDVEGVDFIESNTRRVAFRARTVLNSQHLSDFYAGRPVEGAEDVAKTTTNPGAILEADQAPLSHVPQSRGVRPLRAAFDRKAHDRLQAYVDWAEADDGRDCPGIVPDDVARLLASLTTPPARSYADGVADVVNLCRQWREPGAKVLSSMSGLTDAEHAIAQRTAEGIAEAASGLLSQEGKA